MDLGWETARVFTAGCLELDLAESTDASEISLHSVLCCVEESELLVPRAGLPGGVQGPEAALACPPARGWEGQVRAGAAPPASRGPECRVLGTQSVAVAWFSVWRLLLQVCAPFVKEMYMEFRK